VLLTRQAGFERAMDNLGAIRGPLLAIALVGLVGVRAAIGLSVVPGLLAALAILYAIRHTAAARARTHQPIRIRVRPVLHGRLGRLMVGVTAFELGNAAATLLILRATDLFGPGRSQTAATQLALVLYVLYNLAATVISVPAGWHGDRSDPIRVLATGAVCFTAGYLVFAVGPRQPYILAARFILAGLGIGGVRPPSPPPSRPWPRPACAVRRSGCSPPPRPGPTSPPAPSPGSCGRPCPRPWRSCSRPPRWPSPSR
jgi:dipeptide/tripeptide permease